jgi:hypothetical protein
MEGGFAMLSVDAVNTKAAQWSIAGWFVGLAYFNWFASSPPHVPLWAHAVLVVAGMFFASIVIGGGVAFLMALLTKATTKSWEGSSDFFAWGAFISPVLCFFAAKYALMLFQS